MSIYSISRIIEQAPPLTDTEQMNDLIENVQSRLHRATHSQKVGLRKMQKQLNKLDSSPESSVFWSKMKKICEDYLSEEDHPRIPKQVEIRVGDKIIMANKDLLALSSEYFKAILAFSPEVISLNNVRPRVVEFIMDYMHYSRFVGNHPFEFYVEVYACCHEWQLEELSKKIFIHLFSVLFEENVDFIELIASLPYHSPAYFKLLYIIFSPENSEKKYPAHLIKEFKIFANNKLEFIQFLQKVKLEEGGKLSIYDLYPRSEELEYEDMYKLTFMNYWDDKSRQAFKVFENYCTGRFQDICYEEGNPFQTRYFMLASLKKMKNSSMISHLCSMERPISNLDIYIALYKNEIDVYKKTVAKFYWNNPKDYIAIIHMGLINFYNNNMDDVLSFADLAETILSDHPFPCLLRLMCYLKKGEIDKANRMKKKALEFAPNIEDSIALIEHLKPESILTVFLKCF